MSPHAQDVPGDPRFAARLAEAFPALTAPRIERLEGGLLHETFAVEDRGGRFILQRVADAFSPAVHANVDAVTAHLAARGEPTFRLQRTAEGDLLWEHESTAHRLMTRLPGRSFETCPGPDAARSAGAAMARFHSALADFDAPLAELGFAYREPEKSFAALAAAVASHVDHPHHAEVARLAERIEAARAEWPPEGDLPVRVIHGDLKFSNVLLEGGEAIALVDLDTVLRRPLYHDLGDAWRSWCNRNGEDAEEAAFDLGTYRAAVDGYFEATPLVVGSAERASLVHGLERLSLELASRFAADALEGRYFGWDEASFGSREEHNLVRARGQLSLYEQVRANRAECTRILEG